MESGMEWKGEAFLFWVSIRSHQEPAKNEHFTPMIRYRFIVSEHKNIWKIDQEPSGAIRSHPWLDIIYRVRNTKIYGKSIRSQPASQPASHYILFHIKYNYTTCPYIFHQYSKNQSTQSTVTMNKNKSRLEHIRLL